MLAVAMKRLAEERGFRLSSTIMNNCPWQRGLVLERIPDDVYPTCDAMRSTFFDDILPTMGADLVVLASKAHSGPGWENYVSAVDAADHPDETFDQMMERKAQETVDEVTAAGARVAIVSSIFGTGGYRVGGFDPLDCLARADRLADCAIVPPTSPPPVDAAFTSMAVDDPDVYVADLRPAYCAAPICSPVVDGVVTWHDPNHFSDAYALAIRDGIWDALRGSGALQGLGTG